MRVVPAFGEIGDVRCGNLRLNESESRVSRREVRSTGLSAQYSRSELSMMLVLSDSVSIPIHMRRNQERQPRRAKRTVLSQAKDGQSAEPFNRGTLMEDNERYRRSGSPDAGDYGGLVQPAACRHTDDEA